MFRPPGVVAKIARAAVISALLAVSPGRSLAATFTWDGGGGDDNWSTADNWNPNGAPATDGTAALLFVGALRPGPVNDFAPLTAFTDLSFGASATAFTLSGASITLSGNIDDATASTTQAINLNLALSSANHTVNVANTGTLSVGGVLSGAGASVTKTGFGTLTLSGANSYTGATVVRNGSIVLDFANPAAPTSQILYDGVGSGRNLTLGKDASGEGGDNNTRAYSALVVNGSTAGVATPVSQTFDSTTFGVGVSRVHVTKGTDPGSTTTVDLGAITHAVGGTTFFLLPTKSAGGTSTTAGNPGIFIAPVLTATAGTVHTTSTNSNGTTGAANGILGGWAYIADTLFGLPAGNSSGSFEVPVNSGRLAATEFASVDASGNIVPFTGYTNLGPTNPSPGTNLKIVSNPNAVVNFKVVYTDNRATAQFLPNAVPNGQVTVLFAPGTDTSAIAIGQYFTGLGTFSNGNSGTGLRWSTVAAIDSPTQIRLQPFPTGATSGNTGLGSWSVYAPGVQQLDMNTAGLTDVNSIRMEGATGRSIRVGTNNTLRLGKSGAVFYSTSLHLTFPKIGTQSGISPVFPGTGVQNDGTLTAGGPDVAGVAQAGELNIHVTMPSEVSGGLSIDTLITDNPGDDNNYSTGPNGMVTLVKSGSGSLSIGGKNTYSGGTYILEGKVTLNGSGTVQAGGGVGLGNPDGFGTGPVYILPGGLWFAAGVGAGVNFTNNLYIAGTGSTAEAMGAIRFGAGGNYVGTMTLIGDATLGGGNSTFSFLIGQITGNHNLSLGGRTVAHELVLANPNPNGTPGANDYTGDTQMNSRLDGNSQGLYHLGADEQIPNGAGFGNLIMNNVATGAALTIFDLRGFNETVNGLSSINQASQIVIENRQNGTTSTLTIGDADASSTFGGTIRDNTGGGATGKVALTKIGAGTQTLSGINSYSGATVVRNGSLVLDFADPAAPTSQILYSGVGSARNLTLGKPASGEGAGNVTRATAALVVTGSTAGTATPVTQTFDSTTFGKGISHVEVTKGTDPGSTTTVDLGAITHTVGGATFFLLPTKSAGSISTTAGDPGIFISPSLTKIAGTARTSSTNSNGTTGAANGILGGWAFISDTLIGLPAGSAEGSFDLRAGSGNLAATELASVDTDGSIVPFTGYTDLGPINNSGSNLKIVSNPNAVVNFKAVYTDHRATAQFLATTVPNGQITVLFAPGTDTSQIAIGQYFSGSGLTISGNGNNGHLWTTVVAIDSPTQIRLQSFPTGTTNSARSLAAWSVYSHDARVLEMAAAGLTDVNSIRIGEGTGRSVQIGTGNTLRLGKSGAIFEDGFSVFETHQLLGTQGSAPPGIGIQNDGALTAGGPDVAGVAQAGELIFNCQGPSLIGLIHVTAQITDNPGDDNNLTTGPNGAVTLIKVGSAPLKLGGKNTYSGGTYILEGRVQLAGSETVQAGGGSGLGNPDGFGTGPVYILPGGQWFASGIGTGINFTNDLFIAGNGTAVEDVGAIRLGAGNLVGTITLIGDATLGGGGSFMGVPTSRLVGRITGNHNLFLGVRTLFNELALANPNPNGTAGSNDWTGNLQMNSRLDGNGQGLYHLGAHEQIPNGAGFGNLTMNNVANAGALTIFDLAGFNETVNGLSSINQANLIVIENRLNGTQSTLTVGDADASSTFNGTIRNNNGGAATGTVALTKIGAGTLRAGGTLSYTGATTINAGTLQLDATQALKKLKLNGPAATLSLNTASSSSNSFEVTSAGGNVNHGANAFSVVGGSGESVAWGAGAQLHVQGSSGGKLVLNASAGTSVSVADNTAQITVEPGATLELAGTVSATSSGANFVNIENNSTTSLHVTGTNQAVGDVTGTGNTTVDANKSLTARRIVQNNLTISGDSSNPAASVIIRRSGTPSPNPEGLDSKVSVLSSLSLANDLATIDPPPVGGYTAAERQYFGSLDLLNNDLIITDGSPALFAEVQDMIRAGLYTNGASGITSHEALFSGDYAGVTWLGSTYNGYDDDFDSNTPDVPLFTSFDGVPLLGGELIVKYTWFGDANLDGLVDGADSSLISVGFFGSDPINQAKNPWLFGDFDYSGLVDGLDSGLLSAGFFGGGDTVHLPEPGGLVLMMLTIAATIPFARKRRLARHCPGPILTQTADNA